MRGYRHLRDEKICATALVSEARVQKFVGEVGEREEDATRDYHFVGTQCVDLGDDPAKCYRCPLDEDDSYFHAGHQQEVSEESGAGEWGGIVDVFEDG